MNTSEARLPKVFWFLFAGQLANRVGNMVVAFLAFYLGSRGLSSGQTGVVLAVLGAGGVVSPPIGGVLADRVGRRFTLVFGMLATAGCLALLGATGDMAVLVVAAGLLGVVGDLYRPASAAVIADVVPRARRAQAFGLMFWAVNLGYPVAGASAGLLAAHGYWLLFAIDAGTCVVFAGLVAVGVPRETGRVRLETEGPTGYRTALGDRLFVTLVLLTTAYGTIYAQAMVGVPLAMRDAGLDPSAYGLIPVVNGALIVLLQPLATRWLTRFAPLRVLAVSWGTVGVGMALTGLASGPGEYAATAVVWTLGEVGVGGFTASLVADLAPASAQARYQAVFGFGWGLSKLVAAAVCAGLSATVGLGVLWWGCAGMGAACAVAGVLLAPASERRRAGIAQDELDVVPSRT